MAARVAPADTQQLHHFVSTSPWPTTLLGEELVKAADRLLGGPDAVLVVHHPNAIDALRFGVSLAFVWPAIAKPRQRRLLVQ